MEKIIHYCWFGNNKLDKLAKKCIESWKKYLPDYKIMLWNEENFDVNSTLFSKTAYEKGKWAFVSDVARIYALKKYGGIYFDTDMLVTKDISDILESDFFAGWETEHNVAVGVLGSKNKNHPILEKLYKIYEITEWDEENVWSLTIPRLLTRILINDYALKKRCAQTQYLNDGVVIYANDYFYPISAERAKPNFTDRTCMIHYYNGSWLGKAQRRMNRVYNVLGERLAKTYYEWKYDCKRFIKTSIRLFGYPVVKRRRDKIIDAKRKAMLQEFIDDYKSVSKSKYIIFHMPKWMGTTTATKELFDNVCPLDELSEDLVVDYVSDKLIEDGYELIGFSAFALGWEKLITSLREKGSKAIIKVIWHGSNCMNIEDYDWTVFSYIMQMLKDGIIDSVAFVKKSMYEFYKAKGYNVEFIANTIKLPEQISKSKVVDNTGKTRIGIYASGDRWVKNFYNQLCAASLIENVEVECSPLNSKTMDFADLINLDVSGSAKPVPRKVLLKQMSKNTVNLYVTFTECAPLIPFESFEMGVPCLTAANHHYWEGHELENYIVVKENDNVMEIAGKIKTVIDNKDKIMELYKEWKEENDRISKESVNAFLKGV